MIEAGAQARLGATLHVASSERRALAAIGIAGVVMVAAGVSLWMAVANLRAASRGADVAPMMAAPAPSTDPLRPAIDGRDVVALKALVASGANGEAALDQAVRAGWVDGVIVLLNSGARADGDAGAGLLAASRARGDAAGDAIAELLFASRDR